MAEQEHSHDHGEEVEETPGYQPPAPKTMEEILKSDAEDESLRKYKEALLGTAHPIAIEVCKCSALHVVVTNSRCSSSKLHLMNSTYQNC